MIVDINNGLAFRQTILNQIRLVPDGTLDVPQRPDLSVDIDGKAAAQFGTY